MLRFSASPHSLSHSHSLCESVDRLKSQSVNSRNLRTNYGAKKWAESICWNWLNRPFAAIMAVTLWTDRSAERFGPNWRRWKCSSLRDSMRRSWRRPRVRPLCLLQKAWSSGTDRLWFTELSFGRNGGRRAEDISLDLMRSMEFSRGRPRGSDTANSLRNIHWIHCVILVHCFTLNLVSSKRESHSLHQKPRNTNYHSDSVSLWNHNKTDNEQRGLLQHFWSSFTMDIPIAFW